MEVRSDTRHLGTQAFGWRCRCKRRVAIWNYIAVEVCAQFAVMRDIEI
jgi:hypothetical protein